MTTTLFGISNCDTVKKARSWLDQSGVNFHFHDFRKDGLEKTQVQKWLDALGADVIVNKRSTTWKQLNDAQKEQALGKKAADLILEHPTLIKRPLLALNQNFYVGFKPEQYATLFND